MNIAGRRITDMIHKYCHPALLPANDCITEDNRADDMTEINEAQLQLIFTTFVYSSTEWSSVILVRQERTIITQTYTLCHVLPGSSAKSWGTRY
jgi:hypothetical protein